ncbi:DUF3592 domain-containing protein [Hymenobacter edaphi]|uniref:DUF3592 domain-containing protein n=1 Tax=Hymenobacter edaphi TaxID=2211146 RepID=A0A328BGI8_9BACT|nr:DUF3592 domain-containing protein [Hymenobacter edaphi]RAK65755.1 hypothetical protein DLM85_13615 [Hymenobacter edaphi]
MDAAKFNYWLFKIVCVVPIVVGLLLCKASIDAQLMINRLVKSGTVVDGVINIISENNTVDESSTIYTAEYEVAGNLYQVSNKVLIKSDTNQVGRKVKVVYNPHDPTESIIYNTSEVGLYGAFMVIGFALVVLGLLGLKFFKLSNKVSYD